MLEQFKKKVLITAGVVFVFFSVICLFNPFFLQGILTFFNRSTDIVDKIIFEPNRWRLFFGLLLGYLVGTANFLLLFSSSMKLKLFKNGQMITVKNFFVRYGLIIFSFIFGIYMLRVNLITTVIGLLIYYLVIIFLPLLGQITERMDRDGN